MKKIIKMPFGEYQGKKIEDVPAKYLMGIWKGYVNLETRHPVLYGYLKTHIDAIIYEKFEDECTETGTD